MSSRLRAGFGMCVALVSLGAGAQVAEACTEPVFTEIAKTTSASKDFAVAKTLVPIEVTGVTPGTEYLLKVNGREVKEGIAEGDKVTRRFRMPNLGDKVREAQLVMVLANDGCENSPWKLKQKVEYRPAPALPQTQGGDPSPPVQTPTTPPVATPSPAPTVTTPAPKPVTPTLTTPIKPIVPKQPAIVTPVEPAKDARTWVTPVDPYQRGSEAAPQPPKSLDPSNRKTEDANSTAALFGLGGLFVVILGIAAVAWTKFRRYDDEQLASLINPDGKLPSMLDDQAVDLGKLGMAGSSAAIDAGTIGIPMAGRGTVSGALTPDEASAAADTPDQQPTVKAPVIPPAAIKAPLLPPAVNGAGHANGSHSANGALAPNGASKPSDAQSARSYRAEVETELQRILKEAGLDAELEGVLSDARAEAERRGVPMDSDLMLRALTDETNGSAKLSDSAKDELKQRFQRIAAEERGQIRPAGER